MRTDKDVTPGNFLCSEESAWAPCTSHPFTLRRCHTLTKWAQLLYAPGPEDAKGSHCGPDVKKGVWEPELCWGRGGDEPSVAGKGWLRGTRLERWAGPASGLHPGDAGCPGQHLGFSDSQAQGSGETATGKRPVPAPQLWACHLPRPLQVP